MEINTIKVGYLECNCYLLIKNNKVLVIDPGDEAEKIIKEIRNRKVVGVIITHHHFDHIGALNTIIKKYQIKMYDYYNLSEGEQSIEDFKFNIIHTRGHKEDAITIYFKEDKIMFVGDFIFKDSIGRCDLPGGNEIEMKKSINKIKKYDNDITIYPGHGDKTTLEYEKKNNVYFK